ncbi:MAG TPA: carboxypeptidase regulatory-like domain-containing protein [Chitinophagaceae bacterium]|nr:carboxypeptidase regulatory-like domain-containing protein [Chitinophagaceae bacterium]
MLKRILFLLALALFASPFLFAQITTASISGTVRSDANEPLDGATVIATHQPSGTRYTAVTKNGEFSIPNMRVGGPYVIQISYVGYDVDKQEDVYLKLAETFLINTNLRKTTGTLENVVVATGRRNPILNSSRTGTVTNVGLRQITQLPTVSRSLNDVTRATPQANGASIGGGNFRQNNFTIDGSEFNNSFGIGQNLPANGSPISLDAIEEVSVNVTPYDVRQSGFIGSAINAVTRSGTNTFSGSVYHYYRTERLRGDKVGKVDFVRPKEEYDMWGARFGGPIIKNKLFFFLNWEKEVQPKVIQTRIASTVSAPYGSSPQIARPSADSLNYIRSFLLANYGYETGPFDNYSLDILREKIMGRLDWNITNKHRFVVRYSQVEGGEPNPISSSVGGTGLSNVSGKSRIDNNAMWFQNSNYFQGANYYSLSAELNSNIGRAANTFRGTFTFQNDSRSSYSTVFPTVDIMSTSSETQSVPYTTFGYEPFTYNNLRKVKVYSILDHVSWRAGKHNFLVGGQAEFHHTVNGFNRFGASYYRFATWNDFATGQKPTDFALTFSLAKGFADAVSAFKFQQLSVYGQDEIAFSKKFRMTVGLRLDRPSYPSVPQVMTNPLVLSLTFENGEKINTGNLPSTRIMWSPRVGFNWDLYGDRSVQVRGGTGVFTGKIPFVWIVSQSGDNGMITFTQNFNGVANTPGPFNPNPFAYRPATPPPAGTIVPQAITAMVNDFKNPQTWKSTLAVDFKLPLNMIGTVEGIYNKDINTTFFRNPNYMGAQPLNVANYPDRRPIYPTTNQARYINTLTNAGVPTPGAPNPFDPIVIDNGNRGYYASLTFKVEKLFSRGFFGQLAYTKSIAANLHDGSGDQPAGTYQNTEQVNTLNVPSLSTASYVIPDRVFGMVSYRKEYFKHFATTLTVQYSGGATGRFSYVYGADFNRDRITGNDLIYIPTREEVQTMSFATQTVNGVTFDQNAQRGLFEAYIQQDKYLRTHRGQYAERNGALMPWRNQWDVKFMQDLFIRVGKDRHTVQFTADILNFANLIDADWGKFKSVNASSILTPTNQNSLVPGGTVVPQFRLATDRGQIITSTFRDNVSVFSTYSIQFGLRYLFN